MPEVVELRIHGVGGGSPEGLLGEPSAAHTIRVDGDEPAGFYARRADRHVEGYWWGRLTGTTLLQPLWIVLLPFTLINVAGWMHQPLSDRTKPTAPWWLTRVLLWALGVVLTAVYTAWIGILVIDQVAAQWRWGGIIDDDLAAYRIGIAAAFVALVVVFLVARHVQSGYEQVEPPERPPAAGAGQGIRAMAERLGGERRLDQPSFWAHGRQTIWILEGHCAVAFVVLVYLAAVGAARVGAPTLGYGRTVVRLIGVALVLLAALLLVNAVERLTIRQPARDASDLRAVLPSAFRVCGPGVAAATGFALAVGGFSGVELVLRQWLKVDTGVELVLSGAYGIATIAVVVAAVCWLAYHLWSGWRRRAEAHRQLARPPSAVAPSRLALKVALAQAFSEGIRNLDLVLTAPVVVFVPLGLYAAVAQPMHLSRGWPTVFGQWVALLGAGVVLGFLVREGTSDKGRRLVGMLWDVFTFWPRRFHPFGVRAYAERAVPQMEHRLLRHTRADRRVILSAHSQGAVLAVAALAQLATVEPGAVGQVALVTYGSPVVQLYQRFFPAYFDPLFLSELQHRLFDGDRDVTVSWRNYFRRTDYIGKHTFGRPNVKGVDVVIDDPATRPVVDDRPLDDVFPARPDPCRVVFTTLALHSDYNNEVALKRSVGDLRIRLAGRDP